jgi:hypothetical protein
LSNAAFAERVRRGYEQSLEMVLLLKEWLAETNALIDAVVYRLYRLMKEEEINIMKGRGS